MPQYLISILLENLGPLEAMALQSAITSSAAPHLKPSDYKSLLRTVSQQTKVLQPKQIRQPMQVEKYDPEAAAEYFERMGMKVTKSS